MDYEVHPEAGGGADPPGSPGRRRYRRGPAAGGGVQPAGQRQDHRGQAAPGPGRAVPVHQRAGQGPSGHRDPVVSVDTKKKELVGEFANAGREWRSKGQPAATRTHDFPGDSVGKAIPYGVYDVTADAGWVNVGTDHDTAAFAVESIRRWWDAAGQSDCPQARRLLITADAGGSNGY